MDRQKALDLIEYIYMRLNEINEIERIEAREKEKKEGNMNERLLKIELQIQEYKLKHENEIRKIHAM